MHIKPVPMTLAAALTIALAGPAHAADKMVATIMGSGSPNYNEERASAGVLITKGDTQILIDMGPGVRANLYRAGVDDRKFDALLFTHHHVDHNAEFISMLVRSVVGRDPVAIYGPSQTTQFTNTYLDLYKDDLNYRLGRRGRTLEQRRKDIHVTDLKSGDSFTIDDIKVTTLEVPHSIETLAYRFDYKDQSIVITGDLTYTNKLAPFAKDANCMIIDAGGMQFIPGTSLQRKRKGPPNRPPANGPKRAAKQNKPAHLNLQDSSFMAGKANVDTMVYTHFRPGVVDEQASLNIIRQNYDGKVVFSKDRMQLSCGN